MNSYLPIMNVGKFAKKNIKYHSETASVNLEKYFGSD